MKSICLIDVYFGKLPNWINLFLETCRYNPTVNWIIFIDDKIPDNVPPNVKFIKYSIKNMNILMSRTLQLDIKVLKPYKYCDIRPSFGVIFNEWLRDYDFWGHTDLDVLFGDIRAFISDSLMSKFDIISSDKRKVCGPFTIFRNNKTVNTIYKSIKKPTHYKEIFETADKHYHSNEQAMTTVVNEIANQGLIKKTYRDLHKYDIGSYVWEDGKIKCKHSGEYTMYVHLRKMKDKLDPKKVNTFEVNPQGFQGDNEWVQRLNDGK